MYIPLHQVSNTQGCWPSTAYCVLCTQLRHGRCKGMASRLLPLADFPLGAICPRWASEACRRLRLAASRHSEQQTFVGLGACSALSRSIAFTLSVGSVAYLVYMEQMRPSQAKLSQAKLSIPSILIPLRTLLSREFRGPRQKQQHGTDSSLSQTPTPFSAFLVIQMGS